MLESIVIPFLVVLDVVLIIYAISIFLSRPCEPILISDKWDFDYMPYVTLDVAGTPIGFYIYKSYVNNAFTSTDEKIIVTENIVNKFPKKVLQCVVAHEHCHTIHHDHSDPDEGEKRKLDRELRCDNYAATRIGKREMLLSLRMLCREHKRYLGSLDPQMIVRMQALDEKNKIKFTKKERFRALVYKKLHFVC